MISKFYQINSMSLCIRYKEGSSLQGSMYFSISFLVHMLVNTMTFQNMSVTVCTQNTKEKRMSSGSIILSLKNLLALFSNFRLIYRFLTRNLSLKRNMIFNRHWKRLTNSSVKFQKDSV
jgi:hypothetical protein